MNLPNKLTIVRVLVVPLLVFFFMAQFIPGNDFIALGLFIFASLTDLFDGMIARKKNLVTNFGKFMDPVADKLLVISSLLCLLVVDGGERICSNQVLGLIAVMIIIARELIIDGFRLVASDNGSVIAASMWGKIKTATTMLAICLMTVVKRFPIIKEVTTVVFWIAVTLTVVSLVDYVAKNRNVMLDKKEEHKPKFDEETGLPLN